ncbi:MAG: hypothetical protein L0154_17240 [Chloroflexi bacterium]|nr:hypothetical protein [Chloroflexota bacterium]
MSGLALKRLVVVIISQILGLGTTALIVSLGFDALPLFTAIQTPQGRSVAEFGIQYFLVTAVPIGIVFMVWMDLLLDTRILPD